MKINEIFYSIEGEGIRAGHPCVFIRTFGCNLNCNYCDSQYACKGDNYTEMSIVDILNEVKKYNTRYITITGGEPLIQDEEEMSSLIMCLLSYNYYVNIETNGAADLAYYREIRWNEIPNIYEGQFIFTMDWKSDSCGMSKFMNKDNLACLGRCDVLKFVVGSEQDLIQMKELLQSDEYLYSRVHIFVSPVFGKINPKYIVEFLKQNGLDKVRLQLQIHKFIWDPDERGV